MPAAAPPPIDGTPIDPPPKGIPPAWRKLDRSAVGGVAVRAMRRYSHAKVGLLAAGTAYYCFLALLSLLAFAYGVTATVGADQIAATLTESLRETLPGLVGEDGINPAVLRQTGAAAGGVGLLVLLYSSLGAVGGATNSMHQIYGAPPDPRNVIKAKSRALIVMLVAVPPIALSFVAVAATSSLLAPVLARLGIESDLARAGIVASGYLIGYLLNLWVLWFLIGTLGGIRPHRKPRLIAAAVGAIAVQLVQNLLERIISWSLDKPQYGALAIPLAILFVLSLLATALYGTAALAAAISDLGRTLEDLAPTGDETVGD